MRPGRIKGREKQEKAAGKRPQEKGQDKEPERLEAERLKNQKVKEPEG